MNSTLLSFRQFRNWEEKGIAKELSISEEEYKNLESGIEKVDAETAIKLSELFLAPPHIFLTDNFSNHHTVIYSNCHFENSNGYVNHLYEDENSEHDNFINSLKEDIKKLHQQNDQLSQLLTSATLVLNNIDVKRI